MCTDILVASVVSCTVKPMYTASLSNLFFLDKAFPMRRKSDTHEGLPLLAQRWCSPEYYHEWLMEEMQKRWDAVSRSQTLKWRWKANDQDAVTIQAVGLWFEA